MKLLGSCWSCRACHAATAAPASRVSLLTPGQYVRLPAKLLLASPGVLVLLKHASPLLVVTTEGAHATALKG